MEEELMEGLEEEELEEEVEPKPKPAPKKRRRRRKVTAQAVVIPEAVEAQPAVQPAVQPTVQVTPPSPVAAQVSALMQELIRSSTMLSIKLGILECRQRAKCPLVKLGKEIAKTIDKLQEIRPEEAGEGG